MFLKPGLFIKKVTDGGILSFFSDWLNMRSWVKYKIKIKYLILILITLILGLTLTETTKVKTITSYSQLQIQAANIMSEAIEAIRADREERGIPVNIQLDPNKTGLIGEEYTILTTTLGNLSAKRTSTNPDFAALMVKYFQQVDLRPGDVIAIGSSGSFPALLLATLAASEAMKLSPITIYAIGASEYGATIPNFTFIDMLNILNQKNIINYKLSAVSMGGNHDQAEGMFFPDSRKTIENIAEQSNTHFINTGSLVTNIRERIRIYQETAGEKSIKLFVNIGGASANFGDTINSINFPNGLVFGGVEIPSVPERGLLFDFLAAGIPVIHLLNIRDLALKNGIPIDPIPFPKIGQSEVYYQYRIQKWIILFTILVAIGLLIYFKKFNL